jgi:hypothetical protein
MRIPRPGVAGLAAVMVVASVLLSGCELREGDPREYGNASVGTDSHAESHADSGLDTRQF